MLYILRDSTPSDCVCWDMEDLENPKPKPQKERVLPSVASGTPGIGAPSQFPTNENRKKEWSLLQLVMLVWVLALLLSNLLDTTTKETIDLFVPDKRWDRALYHWSLCVLVALALIFTVKALTLKEAKAALMEQERLQKARTASRVGGHYSYYPPETLPPPHQDPGQQYQAYLGTSLSSLTDRMHTYYLHQAEDKLRNRKYPPPPPPPHSTMSRSTRPKKSTQKKRRTSPPPSPRAPSMVFTGGVLY